MPQNYWVTLCLMLRNRDRDQDRDQDSHNLIIVQFCRSDCVTK
jgi:hypothetical protein